MKCQTKHRNKLLEQSFRDSKNTEIPRLRLTSTFVISDFLVLDLGKTLGAIYFSKKLGETFT